VLLLPFIVWVAAGWIALYWIAATFRYMRRGERLLGAALLCASALAVPAYRFSVGLYGLAADPTAGGVVVRPSQPLRDAVALSKDLAVEGFKVQVRRATGSAPRPAPSKPAAASAPAAPAPMASGDSLYRVRVGPYADRAAAVVALRDLDAKGYKGFIARGEQ
jgi:hypothetical protein